MALFERFNRSLLVTFANQEFGFDSAPLGPQQLAVKPQFLKERRGLFQFTTGGSAPGVIKSG